MTSTERHEARYQRRKSARDHKKQEYNKLQSFEKIFTYDNLYIAYRKCILGKKWKASIQNFIASAPSQIYRLYCQLRDGEYHADGYVKFYLVERGKKRYIQSVGIKDRVVQRCLCDNLLVPILEKQFIYDNGACIKEKGIDFSRRRFKKHLENFVKQNGTQGYILKFDFKSYFANLDHNILKREIRKYFTDKKVLIILDEFVDSFDEGLGLGSQISYLFALMMINPLDHYIKEKLHIKHYGRYMDDGYLIYNNKEYLEYCLDQIIKICEEYKISLNLKKTTITKLDKEFIYLKRKYKIMENNKILIRPCKDLFVRARRKLKKLNKMVDINKRPVETLIQSYQAAINATRNAKSWKSLQGIKQIVFNDKI